MFRFIKQKFKIYQLKKVRKIMKSYQPISFLQSLIARNRQIINYFELEILYLRDQIHAFKNDPDYREENEAAIFLLSMVDDNYEKIRSFKKIIATYVNTQKYLKKQISNEIFLNKYVKNYEDIQSYLD